MSKQTAAKHRRSVITRRKATTVRLDPSVRRGMLQLQTVFKKPLSRLVNEALRGFIENLTLETKSDLQRILTRVRANRRLDPKFENDIARFADAEAMLGSRDPVEGRTKLKIGPMQTTVRELLRG